jgi:hypothetical protein
MPSKVYQVELSPDGGSGNVIHVTSAKPARRNSTAILAALAMQTGQAPQDMDVSSSEFAEEKALEKAAFKWMLSLALYVLDLPFPLLHCHTFGPVR